MRIGIDARLPAFRPGGISEYTIQLIGALAPISHTHEFTIFHAAHDPVTRFPSNAPHMTRANLSTPCHHRFERILLSAELRPFKLDVFHSPDFIPPIHDTLRRVITVHDLSFLRFPQHMPPDSAQHYGGQIAWAVETADRIIAISRHTHANLVDRFPHCAPKAIAIPLAAADGYQPEQNSAEVAAALSRYNLPPGFVLFVGTIEPRKNLPTLIRAVERLSASDSTTPPLVIVGGKGWLDDEAIDMIDRSPADVRHLGRIPAADLARLYAAAAVLALPSFDEGFGLPVLEAMTCGCPVVSSDLGALRETAGDAAVFVEPRDTSGWARELSRVLRDRNLRRDLRERGIARARQFSWATTAAATLKVYEDA